MFFSFIIDLLRSSIMWKIIKTLNKHLLCWKKLNHMILCHAALFILGFIYFKSIFCCIFQVVKRRGKYYG